MYMELLLLIRYQLGIFGFSLLGNDQQISMKRISLLVLALIFIKISRSQSTLSNNMQVRFNGFKTFFTLGATTPTSSDTISIWDSNKSLKHFGKAFFFKDSIFIQPSIGAGYLLFIDTTIGVNQGQVKRILPSALGFATGNTFYSGDGTATNRTVTISGFINYIGGEIKIGSSTDQGGFTLQNTGAFYQNGDFSLNGTLTAISPFSILTKQTDSTVTQMTTVPTSMAGTPSGCTTGQVLTKNSNTNYDYSWSSVGGSGVTTIGTINSQTKSTDGAVITGTSLVMQTADASSVGLVSTSAQIFAGAKTFQDGLIGQTSSSSVSKIALTGDVSGSGEPGVFGLGLAVNQYTYTDNGAARTVGNIQQMNKIADPTLAAVNAVTYTTAANLYVMDLTAGSNVTITQSRSIYALGTTYLEQFATGINESASASVSMAKKGLYVATGTTATYTLPDRNAYLGVVYFIKNAGSGDLTVQRAGSDQLYDTSAVNSVIIPAGSARIISAGSNYWYVQ